MSQDSLVVDNSTFPVVRADINAAVKAAGTNQHGTATPTFGTFSLATAGMPWVDANASPLVYKMFTSASSFAELLYIYASATQGYAKMLPTASQTLLANQAFRATATAPGTAGPDFIVERSVLATGVLGRHIWAGVDAGGNALNIGIISMQFTDTATATSDSKFNLQTLVGGTLADRVNIGAGLFTATVAGGDQGVGTLNVGQLFVSGVGVVNATAFATQSQLEASVATATTNLSLITPPSAMIWHPGIAKFWGSVTYSGGVPTLATTEGRGSHNISSIVDTASGQLTVNIGTDFSSSNYALGISGSETSGGDLVAWEDNASRAAGSFLLKFGSSAGAVGDPGRVGFIGFGRWS